MTSTQQATVPATRESILRYLVGTGCALWLLVMALQPDVGFAAPLPWMGLFWLMKIGCGLAVLQSLLYLFSRSQRWQRWPLWTLVAGSGIVGSALLAPLYWLIGEGLMQAMLGFEATLDDENDSGTAIVFGLSALLQEFGDLVGPVTASWLLISWPRLQGLLPLLLIDEKHTGVAGADPVEHQALTPGASASRPAWRTALPGELGDDLIAVSSELQYMRVWTSRGTALILGALQEVEDTEGQAGMRVHRSWWVHARHVSSVRRRADGLVCQMSDGREIPVSRRRKADVLARFGDTARYETTASAGIKPFQAQ
jgi:hypothetical protein